METKKVAVMVIDMTQYFVEELLAQQGAAVAEALIARQQEVLRLCAEHDVRVIKVEMKPQEFGTTIESIDEAIERVPRAKRFLKFENIAFNAPYSDDLIFMLHDEGVEILFFMGLNAGACVAQSAFAAVDRRMFDVATEEGVISSCEGRDDIRKTLAWFANTPGAQVTRFEDLLGI